jgi:hypothetical protein
MNSASGVINDILLDHQRDVIIVYFGLDGFCLFMLDFMQRTCKLSPWNAGTTYCTQYQILGLQPRAGRKHLAQNKYNDDISLLI